MKFLIFAAAVLVSAPAFAQSPSATAGTADQLDAQRLATARSIAAKVLPEGAYEHMMDDLMESVVDQILGSMLDMKVGEVLPEGTGSDRNLPPGDTTIREIVAKKDPHFEERNRITMKVMAEEMKPLIVRLEPKVREAMALIWARRFDSAKLSEVDRFFSTPTGSEFAAQFVTSWMDKEVMRVSNSMMPELAKDMPRIMKRIAEATAHLPPPPKGEADGKDAEGESREI